MKQWGEGSWDCVCGTARLSDNAACLMAYYAHRGHSERDTARVSAGCDHRAWWPPEPRWQLGCGGPRAYGAVALEIGIAHKF